MAKTLAQAQRAPARGKVKSVRGKSMRSSSKDPHPQPLPTRGRGGSCRTVAAKPKAPPKQPKHKGDPVPGTPSPMRTRMSPELQAHVRRLYEETDQPVCQIALDVGVNESVIRRMGPREGWVRYVAPPRDLPPVAKLLEQVEELEEAVRAPQHDEAALTHSPTPTPDPSPQGGGEQKESVAAPEALTGGGEKEDNIARFTHVVMAHLDEFEAMRRDGKLLPKHHLATARAISILTEAFNRLARLRAALPGTIHDDTAHDNLANFDMPADLDAFREALAQRIEKFLASRTDAGAFTELADVPAERTDE